MVAYPTKRPAFGRNASPSKAQDPEALSDTAACVVLQMQGFLPKLLIAVRQAFPSAVLYTPADHGARNASDWPSMADLVTAGKRVMVVSGADYGADAAGVLFTRPQICNWQVQPVAQPYDSKMLC